MQERRRRKLSQLLGLTLGGFTLWIMLSGRLEIKFLLIGLFSSLAISIICLPFLLIKDASGEKDYFVFGINFLRLAPYCVWLLMEIFRSSIDVIHEMLKLHMNYEPRIVYFKMPYENPMASVFLANSIILTPGTITLDVLEGGVFEVHALNKKAANDMLSGRMQAKVAKLFKETCTNQPMPEAEMTDIPKEVY